MHSTTRARVPLRISSDEWGAGPYGEVTCGIPRPDVSKYYRDQPGAPPEMNVGWEHHAPDHPEECIVFLQAEVSAGVWETILRITEPPGSTPRPSGDIERTLELSHAARSRPTVVVVDDFYANPDGVRALALTSDMRRHPEAHKGLRSDRIFHTEELRARFEGLLGPGARITEWKKYGTNGCFQHCPAGETIVYHRDHQQFAAAVYLTPDAPAASGTTLWRPVDTRALKRPEGEGARAAEARSFAGGYLDPFRFERIDSIGNVYNRLVLWDAHVVHSASAYFGQTASDSRLFQLFFFDATFPTATATLTGVTATASSTHPLPPPSASTAATGTA